MERKLLRILCFVAGILINSFGIAFITKAALGTSPISSLPYVLSQRFTLTLGQFTFIMNTGFIVAQIVLLGREFEKRQILQIGVNIVFSWFIDVSMKILPWILIHSQTEPFHIRCFHQHNSKHGILWERI